MNMGHFRDWPKVVFLSFLLFFIFKVDLCWQGVCMAWVLRSEATSPTPSPLPCFLFVSVYTKLVGPPAPAGSLVSASHLFLEDTGQHLALHQF